MSAIFTLKNIGLEFIVDGKKRPVLDDINLIIDDKKIYTIVGASGCGKTSLLRILGGLNSPSKGQIHYHNQPVTSPPVGVAFVFQDYSNSLLPWRTVEKNVALGIERDLSKKACLERVKEALHLVKLSNCAKDYPWQLSGGMQQRVQIARALATRPSVLLMDEPFAALDAMTKASLQDELLRLRDETGASIVFITHDIEEAIYLGDEVSVLIGPPGKITSHFSIELPFPRDQIKTRELPAFLKFRSDIHHAIQGQS